MPSKISLKRIHSTEELFHSTLKLFLYILDTPHPSTQKFYLNSIQHLLVL
jgi:hypothetical protein